MLASSTDTTGRRIQSVMEITRDVRSALEGRFRDIWVEGEVSNVRLPSSGHKYFTLKDEYAQISCVIFRHEVQRNRIEIKDGQKLQVHGDVTVFEQRGQYQIVIDQIQLAGQGELQAKFEALKQKLNAEGLFAPEKKQPIPFFPKTVGIVTSPSGAALQDIRKVMARRAPWIHLVVIPVSVQGDAAAGQIARAIEYISTQPEHLPKLDTLIVARGGGSIEDLWSFNEEIVARAIFACPIPTISGVGHEIDFTIADFVADRREPTPSAAAEASVPDGVSLSQRLLVIKNRLDGATEGQIQLHRNRINAFKREMEAREPARKLQNWAQSMDFLEERMENAISRRLENQTAKLERLEAILAGWNLEKDIHHAREKAKQAFERLNDLVQRNLEGKSEQLEHFSHLLRAIGPDKTLKRGFSMTLDENGKPVLKASKLKKGQLITTRFSDSEVKSRVEEI